MSATTLITGNTYPVKEQLKAIGARWNADAKGWMVPTERAEQAKAIVASAGKATFTPTAAPSVCRCSKCGEKIRPNEMSPSTRARMRSGKPVRCADCLGGYVASDY